ncbi:hypothetical protein ACI2L1_39795 [Streptomyces sp. NPDC019531]|uniref:hypothetical protein n=1 Tax=Streptomyces sp. NPDC019531 TaxID=3365062 RepID=UPI00384E506E
MTDKPAQGDTAHDEAAPRWEETARRVSNAHSGEFLSAGARRAAVQDRTRAA